MRKPPTPEKIVKCIQKLKLSHTDFIAIDKGHQIDLSDVGIWTMEHDHIVISKSHLDEHEDFADKIADVMFDLSLGYVIRWVGEDGLSGWLHIQLFPTEDGTTNITADVIQAIIDKMTPAN